MSTGRVWHIGCPGEWLYNLIRGRYECSACDAAWDGRRAGVAEYRQNNEVKEGGDGT